jgi:hypothetical protein
MTAVRLLTGVACIKIALAAAYLFTIAWPANTSPTFITTHNDSLVFVMITIALVATWAHAPSWPRLVSLALAGGWVLVGMLLNGRRLAFVGLFVALLLLYVQLGGPVKRAITRAGLYATPIMLLYLLIGRNRQQGFFKLAGLIGSVTRQSDASSAMRDIENTNLIHTLRQSRLLGTGWGHEYIELVKAYDISELFAQYRYVPHNGVLWLWSVGGVPGLTLLWMPLAIGVFLARRSYVFARTAEERTAALIALAVMASYVIQAWGDMGTQGLTCTLLLALSLAASGKLAVATGAVPARTVFFGRQAAPPVSLRLALPTEAA